LENLPFYGNIYMEIGIMGKFPWIYGTMPGGGGRQVKIYPTFSGNGGQVARGVAYQGHGNLGGRKFTCR
jgi:hypothetical protein